MSRLIFRKLDWAQEPFGEQGVRWFERKPSSLTAQEWKQLNEALHDGRISYEEYFNWKDAEDL